MPLWVQTVLTIIYLLWLFAVLFVMWMVWRKQVQRLATLEAALMRDSKISAEAAKMSAEAACMLAAKLKMNVVEEKPLL